MWDRSSLPPSMASCQGLGKAHDLICRKSGFPSHWLMSIRRVSAVNFAYSRADKPQKLWGVGTLDAELHG